MKKWAIGAAVAAAAMWVMPALAGTITIGWDAVGDSDLAGYRVYYGTASRNYGQQIDVGRVTAATLDVADCTSYYVAVKARDAAGHLSAGFSREASGYARPRVGLVTPAVGTQGSEADVVLTGANFRPGATVRFGNTGITVTSATVQSCVQMTAHVRMGSGAALGLTSVEVVNPDDTFGTSGALFLVMPASVPLSVTGTVPMNASNGVPVSVHPRVTFSQPILESSITPWNIRLLDESGRAVPQAPGSPSLGPTGNTIIIVPVDLAYETDYRIYVVGGSTGVRGAEGSMLVSSFLEDPAFTTEEDPGAALSISEVRVTPQSTSADISWTTTAPAGGKVFYRRIGAAGYQVSPPEASPVTRHWVQITNLEPSTDYAFYVESEDENGNSVRSTPETRFTTGLYAYLRLEAENGRLTLPVRRTSGSGAFRGAWIDTPSGAPRGTEDHTAGNAELQFFVPGDDTWHVWVRLYGLDETTDSWFLSMDGSTPHVVGPSFTPGWAWTRDGSYTLTRGEHVLELGGREQETRADRLLITNDPDYVPDSRPGSDVQPPVPVNSVSADVLDDGVQLSWSNPVSDAVQILITYRTDGVFPMNPSDGMKAGTAVAIPLLRGTMRHSDPMQTAVYWYSIFAIDAAGNASDPMRIRVAR